MDPTLVEISTDGGGTWTARPTLIVASDLVEALPPQIGSATLIEHQPDSAASYLPDGTAIAELDEIAVGTWVRVSSITGYDATAAAQTAVRWTGVVVDSRPNDDATERMHLCMELSQVLDQWRAPEGLTIDNDPDEAGLYSLDDWPVFNAGGLGNRSPGTMAIGAITAYVHQIGTGNSWTAQQIAATLLAQLNAEAAAAAATALPWTLTVTGDAATAAAARVRTWDLRGLSLWQILGALFTGHCPWRIVPGAAAIEIRLGGTASHAIDGSDQAVVVRDYNPGLGGRMDRVEVRSAERPLCTISLYANGANTGTLRHDWSEAEQTGRIADPDNPAYAHVYVRYRLMEGFDGSSDDGTVSGSGIRSPADDLDTRAYDASICDRRLLEFAGGAAVIGPDSAPSMQPPGVWLGANDISDRCTIHTGNDGLGPWLEIVYLPADGGDGAAWIAAAWDNGDPLVITIALREPTHRYATYRATSRPGPLIRSALVTVGGREWHVAGTARLREQWGSTTGSILKEDDLVAIMARLVADRFGPSAPAAAVTVDLEGTIDTDEEPAPGDLVTITGTAHGSIGPSRVLARTIIVDDPRQALSLRCGRGDLSTEATPA